YLKHEREDDPVLRYTAWFERLFQALLGRYQRVLDWCLRNRPVVLVTALATLVGTIAIAIAMPKGFFPTEDIGQISVNAEAVEDISFPAMVDILQKVGKVIGDNAAV